jgi:hypothetical protein
MEKFDLAKSVLSVKAPPLDRKETRLLIEEVNDRPWNNQVAQLKPQVVAQQVAQDIRVAQEGTQKVAQFKPQVVQHKPSVVKQRVKDFEELLVDKDVNELKARIFQIDGVEKRKKFIRDIGWGIIGEKRGKKYYLYGAKKISGRKYKLYIGNATN